MTTVLQYPTGPIPSQFFVFPETGLLIVLIYAFVGAAIISLRCWPIRYKLLRKSVLNVSFGEFDIFISAIIGLVGSAALIILGFNADGVQSYFIFAAAGISAYRHLKIDMGVVKKVEMRYGLTSVKFSGGPKVIATISNWLFFSLAGVLILSYLINLVY